MGGRSFALSFVRTVTVGPGIAPGLLTPRRAGARCGRSRAGAGRKARHYRRWGISPRPENACVPQCGGCNMRWRFYCRACRALDCRRAAAGMYAPYESSTCASSSPLSRARRSSSMTSARVSAWLGAAVSVAVVAFVPGGGRLDLRLRHGGGRQQRCAAGDDEGCSARGCVLAGKGVAHDDCLELVNERGRDRGAQGLLPWVRWTLPLHLLARQRFATKRTLVSASGGKWATGPVRGCVG